ncbi:glycosyltransferase family 1 protein [bacterium]|nr:MAG: glycosyltransferase family 1 protein [bacterium]
MKKPILTLFLTENMSLKEWDRIGLLSREMAIYEKLMSDFSIQIFSYGDVGEYYYEDKYEDLSVLIIPYYRKNISLKNRVHLFKALRKLRKSSIIKTNQIKGADRAVFYSKKWGIPLITRCGYLLSTFTEYQSNDLEMVKRAFQLEKEAFQYANMSFVSSERDRNYVMDKHQIREENIITVPNYVNQEVFSFYDGSREKGHVLYIGRLSEQKNLFSLIEAFNKSEKAQKLTLIGKGELGDALKNVSSTKEIEFISALPNHELPIFLNKASIYVLPSYYEGLPKTLLEAMSTGIVCVGTCVEGIKEVIEQNKTGYLCETSADSIASAMDELLSDDAKRKELGRAAHLKISRDYSLEYVAQLEKQVYSRLLNS